MDSGEVRTQGRKFIGIGPLPHLDCQMCQVSFLAIGAGALALLLGWTAVSVAAVLFGLLTLWLAAHLAAAPCCDQDWSDG